MVTRSPFYQLALQAGEGQSNLRGDVLPVPTLDERVTLYLRAIHGNRNFTEEERSNARSALLDSMAAEIAAEVQQEVTEPPRPMQYWQSVQREETIRGVPIARRRNSILALTATLGLALIVAGGTLGYRWTHSHIEEGGSEPSQQGRVPPPTISPRSLSTRPAPDKAAPEQHVVQIASQRSEADVLAVFRKLQQEQPTLFSQATLSRVDLGPPSYSARVGPFASEKDAAAACQVLAAADIRCF
jgi:SPOR domain